MIVEVTLMVRAEDGTQLAGTSRVDSVMPTNDVETNVLRTQAHLDDLLAAGAEEMRAQLKTMREDEAAERLPSQRPAGRPRGHGR